MPRGIYDRKKVVRDKTKPAKAYAFPMLGVLKDTRTKIPHQTRHHLARIANAVAVDCGYPSLRHMPAKKRILVEMISPLKIFFLRQSIYTLTTKQISPIAHERWIATCYALIRTLQALGIATTEIDIPAIEVIRQQLKEGSDELDGVGSVEESAVSPMQEEGEMPDVDSPISDGPRTRRE